jgi:hypothetical protein
MTVIACPEARRLTKMPALGLSRVGHRPVTRSRRLMIERREPRQRHGRLDTSTHASIAYDLARTHRHLVKEPSSRARSAPIFRSPAIWNIACDHSREEVMFKTTGADMAPTVNRRKHTAQSAALAMIKALPVK